MKTIFFYYARLKCSFSQVEGDSIFFLILKLTPLSKKRVTRKKMIVIIVKEEDEERERAEFF
jgi:hypothetical protein